MFETLKKDIVVGDKIKLHLINSNEKPEGTVLEIGENFVLLNDTDGVKSRFFDKLIGGWDIIKSNPVKESISVPAASVKPANTDIPAAKIPVNTAVRPLNNFRPVILQPSNVKIVSKIVSPTVNHPVPASSSQLEKEILTLIKNGNNEKAMQKLNENLKRTDIEDKYKSSFLLKKAQLYSTLHDPENSENTYKELISFNEMSRELKYNTSALSHYCTELARLQAQKPEKLALALKTVKKAIQYNNNNTYPKKLLQKLENKISNIQISEGQDYLKEKTHEEGDLLVEVGDNIDEISFMLKTDFEEHKYTHPSIINNKGIPTPYIADSLLNEAKVEKDLGKSYLIFLDAAKAYQELAPGSYELQNFLRAAASYAHFKGDLLYNKFKNEILGSDADLNELTRIKDSACSYYLESTKLLSTISPESLLDIITNYLLLNVVLYNRKNGKPVNKNNFIGQFGDVVKNCLTSKDGELEKIVWITFIDLGALSSHAWNALSRLPGGTGMLYNYLFYENKRQQIFNLINSIWRWNPIDIKLKPKEYLQAAFKERQKLENEFEKVTNNILKFKFEGNMIDQIIQSWNNVSKYENLLTVTDKETEKVIDNALEIAKPYLKRNPVERTNILIKIQNIIEKQMDFINRNTTIYGRTYFFPLFLKWKKDIGSLLNERIVESGPELKIIIDPPYFFESGNEINIPLIIENEGEATSEGCIIEGNVEKYSFNETLQLEISAGSKTETIINAPLEFMKLSQTINLRINIRAKYQNDIREPRNFQFTLEKESGSNLVMEDIPWKEGPIPVAELFKGREAVIDMLCSHYCSLERGKPYILYGLTRTGKSSILKYLKEKIDGRNILMRGLSRKIITIDWDLSTAANYGKASEFWEYIVYEQSYNKLQPDIKYSVNSLHNFEIKKDSRAKDLQVIIDCFNKAGYYPLFLVDEFSYIKSLLDRNIIQPAFLAVLRQFSLSDQAGFLFAGTYDIKELIEEKEYGITGQLVHAIDYQIDKIDDKAAEELITVLGEKLVFTGEAISHIKKLSGNIPYFIQIICKYCGYYAVEKKRHSIGYPELEKVIRILCGFDRADIKSHIQRLPENVFQNNQYGPGDPDIVPALISSIAWLNRDSPANPRGVRMGELQKVWSEYNVSGSRPKLAEAIKILSDKKIITSEDDEGDIIYKFSVDIFRRWWFNHHPDIKLAMASISE
jgi:hypothetical protein